MTQHGFVVVIYQRYGDEGIKRLVRTWKKEMKLVVTRSLSHTFVQTVAKESLHAVSYKQIFDSKGR